MSASVSSRPGARISGSPRRGAKNLVVDWTRCDGHGLCHALLPEVVDLDEWGFPVIRPLDVSGGLLPHARRAAAACPALALRVEDVAAR